MKKLFSCALIAFFLDVIAVFAIASTPEPNEAESFVGLCYQTMGYCGSQLTYKCTKDQTSERCRLYGCETCLKVQDPEPNDPTE